MEVIQFVQIMKTQNCLFFIAHNLTCFPHFQSGPLTTRAPTPSIIRGFRAKPGVVPTALAISILEKMDNNKLPFHYTTATKLFTLIIGKIRG